jgi:hypothetical protein
MSQLQVEFERARELIARGHQNVQFLLTALSEARGNLEISRRLLEQAAISEARPTQDQPNAARQFSAVDDLAARVAQLVPRRDPMDALIVDIDTLIAGGMAPGTVMGVLLEAMVQVLLEHVPQQERGETFTAVWLMFCKRLNLGA